MSNLFATQDPDLEGGRVEPSPVFSDDLERILAINLDRDDRPIRATVKDVELKRQNRQVTTVLVLTIHLSGAYRHTGAISRAADGGRIM